MAENRRLLNVGQAAAYLNLSPWTVRTLISNREIPVVAVPSQRRPGEAMRRVLIDRMDLDALIVRWKAAASA